MTVRTRFAPSPTGFLHIGGLRTALFCWLYARRHEGVFVLRIEDTDLERSTPTAIQQILDGMEWACLDYDEGPFQQTHRFDRYREVLERMLAEGTAYRCYCSKQDLDAMRAAQTSRGEKPRYDGRCRNRTEVPAPTAGMSMPFVARFRNPLDGEVVVEDVVHGPVVFQNSELDDLIIARSDGSPTYNFCVVVDDMDMHITHVIRGDDHLNNTPRQLNMLLAMGAKPPVYAHLPMILGSDGAKLSKRHGAMSVLEYREQGFLAEALLNYLVRLGWSHGDQEIFSLAEMIAMFDIADVNKSASAFNGEKLGWLNQQHIMHAAPARIVPELRWHLQRLGIEAGVDAPLEAIFAAQKERAKTLAEMAANSVFFFRAPESFDDKSVRKHITRDGVALLQAFATELALASDWTAPGIHALLSDFATRSTVSLGKLAQPIRIAVSGGAVSPPLDATLAILGKRKTLERLHFALSLWRHAAPEEIAKL